MTRPESFVDASKVGTYFDPEMYQTAMVPNGMWHVLRFALDHQRQTARFLKELPREAVTSSAYSGHVHAAIEPWAAYVIPGALPGRSLRLMGFPWNGTETYTIVSEIR